MSYNYTYVEEICLMIEYCLAYYETTNPHKGHNKPERVHLKVPPLI